MSDSVSNTVTMAIDTKKYGIRIHKPLFRQLGEPKYIQLLVNPTESVVAIKTVEAEIPGSPAHRIYEKRMNSDRSYEIYSRSFIVRLREIEPNLSEGGAYRISGEMVPSQKMAIFSLKTLQRMDKAE